MLFWLVGFALGLMCSGSQAQGTMAITMMDRVIVVVLGQQGNLEFTVTTPANTSISGQCVDPEGRSIFSFKVSVESHERVVKRGGSIAFEKSGQYSCRADKVEAYFAVLVIVPEKVYRLPKDNTLVTTIVLGTLNSVLLIFSVLGSIYIFRGHQCLFNKRNGERDREERRAEGRGSRQAESTETSAPVYAALEPQTKSVYEVLHPAAANSENKEKKVKRKSEHPNKLMEKIAQEGMDGDVDCVYENF